MKGHQFWDLWFKKDIPEMCRYYFLNERNEQRCRYFGTFCNIEDCKVYAKKG